ncbi:hypothetical protein Q3G72_011868 [Acer saccharum]|nr:hypothetical protein Q3G72_011868 [Acer saccharum]
MRDRNPLRFRLAILFGAAGMGYGTMELRVGDNTCLGLRVDATTIVLSSTAFATIANSSAASINIEFQQV